jgi:hypothetical protein
MLELNLEKLEIVGYGCFSQCSEITKLYISNLKNGDLSRFADCSRFFENFEIIK